MCNTVDEWLKQTTSSFPCSSGISFEDNLKWSGQLIEMTRVQKSPVPVEECKNDPVLAAVMDMLFSTRLLTNTSSPL